MFCYVFIYVVNKNKFPKYYDVTTYVKPKRGYLYVCMYIVFKLKKIVFDFN